LQQLAKHIVLWVIALSVLNCSIGIPDIDQANFTLSNKETVTNWNEFESVYEWVAEEALDIKNAVPELENKRGNEQTLLKKQAPIFIAQQIEKTKLTKRSYTRTHIVLYEHIAGKPLAGFITLFSPPPDIV
jgi:hypothetical protein